MIIECKWKGSLVVENRHGAKAFFVIMVSRDRLQVLAAILFLQD